MADILIRNIHSLTKERLRRRAKQRGKSLEAYLRETLENLALDDERVIGARQGFGSWLISVSRPGADLSRILTKIRKSPMRRVDLGG
ncbi:MAG: plasmid stability protein y4jJ [Alphaproteobacteria bacterium]|nr:plasmid stability protein y4jJ [Alphaproteobacteria bacterium]